MNINSIQMVDLQWQYKRFKPEINRAVLSVIEKGNYINGPEVNIFAQELSDYLGVGYVVPCANGTDAIQLALMALNLKPGDEVITTCFSFIASAEAIVLLGLVPVFVDVDLHTYNIDSSAIEPLITSKTKCILPVHLFGQASNMAEIIKLADKYNLYVVEDVAQSLGGSFCINGKTLKLGTIGNIGCTSFFPTKNLGCFGDGGALFTNDQTLAQRLKMFASHGSVKQYHHDLIGINSRLDTIQAAVLRVKLKYLDQLITLRQRIANYYSNNLKKINEIITTGLQMGANHTYNQFTIRVLNNKRDSLQNYLREKDIQSRIYYPVPLNKQKAIENIFKENSQCPRADTLCREALSLPIYPGLKKQEVEFITDTIKTYFTK